LHRSTDTQRGLIVLDESSHDASMQQLAREFRVDGHRWGLLRNLSEVSLVFDSRATRTNRFADLIASALRQYYDKGDERLFDIIAAKLDSAGGITHGLDHRVIPDEPCNCF
jgi:hypothetical protein